MTVSVIIPAFNANEWILATLQSLQHQRETDWEAIVVDDGSTDDTAALVEAIDDARVRLIRQPKRGVCAARNAGTAAARSRWLLYLDADDIISSEYLWLVTRALAQHRHARLAVTTWARLAPDGRVYQEVRAGYFDDFFAKAARDCPFAVHACVVARDLVLEVGGWDETLTACEDWDLWARIARAGASYVVVDNALALYRTRPTSASYDGLGMLRGGITVLERVRSADPRVPAPAAAYRNGHDPDDLNERILEHAAWCAGQMIGAGLDATQLLDDVVARRAPLLDPATTAAILDVAAAVGSMGRPLHERWADEHKLFATFLDGLEEVSGSPRLAVRAELELARRAADRAFVAGPLDLGELRTVAVDLHRSIDDLAMSEDTERARIHVTADGASIGMIELRPEHGRVAGERIHRAIADELAPNVFARFAASTRPQPGRSGQLSTLWKPDRLAEALWGDVADRHEVDAIRDERGVWHVDLAAPTRDVNVAPRRDADVAVSLGGRPIATFRLTSLTGRLPIARLRSTTMRYARQQLVSTAASVALVGRELPDLAEFRRRLRSSASPAGAPTRPVPHRLVGLAAPWSPNLERLRPTAVRRARSAAIQLPPAQRRLAKEVLRHARKLPRPTSRHRIPILMYHRVAHDGTPTTDRWRVAPEQLGGHLAALRRTGHTMISLDQLRRIMFDGAPAPRRPVVLTFDDGYTDFAEYAWPRLQANGAGATVFVVAGEVGGTNRWDDVFETPARLMDWPTLQDLAADGLDIGSHSVDHPMLTSLTTDAVLAQAADSKAEIERQTGTEVHAFAYPYGDADTVVADVVGNAGYTMAVTCEHGPVSPRSNALLLPRVEVHGKVTPRGLLTILSRLIAS